VKVNEVKVSKLLAAAAAAFPPSFLNVCEKLGKNRSFKKRKARTHFL